MTLAHLYTARQIAATRCISLAPGKSHEPVRKTSASVFYCVAKEILGNIKVVICNVPCEWIIGCQIVEQHTGAVHLAVKPPPGCDYRDGGSPSYCHMIALARSACEGFLVLTP